MEQIYEKLEAIGASVEKFKERQEQKFNDLQVRLSGIPQHAPALAPVEEAQGRDFERFLRGGEGQKSLSTGEAPGEYLLPAPVQKRIHEGLLAQGVFRALASVMEVSSSHVDLVLDQGLPGAGWVQEGGERPETEGPTLRHHRIETHELYAKPLATQTLLEDSHVNVEEWLVDRVVDK